MIKQWFFLFSALMFLGMGLARLSEHDWEGIVDMTFCAIFWMSYQATVLDRQEQK